MISLITYKNIAEQIEITADKQGIDDLSLFLEGIKTEKDQMHLLIDNEINTYPILTENERQVILIKHVRLESLEWDFSQTSGSKSEV